MVLGVYNTDNFGIGDAFIVSGIAIVAVFVILTLIIFCSMGVDKVAHKVMGLSNIQPRPENKILENDEDAVVALLTATIDFNKETGKDAKLVKITKLED